MSSATTPRRRSTLPADLRAEAVTAIVDTREQTPLDLAPMRTVAGTLATGDYSVAGLESVVAIERKSLADLLGCVGQDRERFEREIQRLLAYPVRALVVESTWAALEAGGWRSQVTPAAAVGSVLGWIAAGVPVVMAGDHARAGRFVARILHTAARRRWREARRLPRLSRKMAAIPKNDPHAFQEANPMFDMLSKGKRVELLTELHWLAVRLCDNYASFAGNGRSDAFLQSERNKSSDPFESAWFNTFRALGIATSAVETLANVVCADAGLSHAERWTAHKRDGAGKKDPSFDTLSKDERAESVTELYSHAITLCDRLVTVAGEERLERQAAALFDSERIENTPDLIERAWFITLNNFGIFACAIKRLVDLIRQEAGLPAVEVWAELEIERPRQLVGVPGRMGPKADPNRFRGPPSFGAGPSQS